MKDFSDIELWEQTNQGSETAFAELYARHIRSLLDYGHKLTSNTDLIKDAAQELFINIWNSKSRLTTPSYVKIYLIRSFRNNLLRSIRKEKMIDDVSLEDLINDVSGVSSYDESELIRRKALLKKTLDQLPERQKEIIHLRYYQNIKNQDIAEILNINPQSVSNLLQRAIKSLKEQIK